MTTPEQLKAALITALGSELGIYTFSVGPTMAIAIETGAIALGPNGEDLATEQPTVTGLEVIIQPQIGTILKSLQGNAFQETRTTALILKQWDIDKTAIAYLPLVLDALIQFPTLLIDSGIRRVPRLNELDNIETVELRLSENLFLQV